MSSDKRVKEGELMKYRNLLYGWKKYYFKLERSYLHYFEGKYTSEPKGTTTRGEISRLSFSQEHHFFGFEIHLNSGQIWYLRAATHEERMEWMRALQPDAYIVDPLQTSQPAAISEQSQPSAPPEEQSSAQSYPRLYPQLPNSNNTLQPGAAPGPPSPPPAYDEINYNRR